MSYDTILFPNLHITLPHVGRSISIGGFEIAYYGIVVAAAMLAGIYLAMWIAKKTGQNPDHYFNFAVVAIVLSVLGARLYYVIFSWDYYGRHPMEIFQLRQGGLAIYGGVLTGVLCAVIYSKIRKIPMGRFLDTAIPALTLGQAIGRWGNFFNREAFGGYTDGLFAMGLPQEAMRQSEITREMLEHVRTADGISFLQVHPTFLYESVWNLLLVGCMLLLLLKGTRRWEGRVFFLYLAGYGLGRFWIERLRTDQLLLPGTSLPVSQILSGLLFVLGAAGLLLGNRKHRKKHRKQRNVKK